MRPSYVGVLMLGTLVACGGGTAAPPHAEGEAVAHPPPKEDAKDTKTDLAPDAAPPPPAQAAATSEPKGPAAAPSSGDLTAPAEDDPWMAPHQMPPGDVLKTMRAAMGKVNSCHNAAKKRDPSVSGDVKIKFVITHEGAVRVWRDEASSMSDPDCTKCVGDVIQGLKFPTQKSPGGAWGLYSINFGG